MTKTDAIWDRRADRWSPDFREYRLPAHGQYNGKAIIPLEDVCQDYFSHLTPTIMLRKICAGEIALPLVRIDVKSQKTAKGIHLQDLADHLDARVRAARKECEQLNG